MELENSFLVPADIDTAWNTLLDVESIAPCMPGATLTSFTGDEFAADVKVKLGPVTMVFGGTGKFVSKDVTTHTAVIDAAGKEVKGGGNASAKITATLTPEGPDATRATIVTDLTITGKAAQFGRGVMADVSKRLIDQFAGNLQTVIEHRKASAAPAAVPEAAEAGDDVVATKSPTAAAPPVMNNDALDLGSAAMGPILKRAIPALIGVIVVVGVIWWIVAR
jgi:carbon monoxide dehydrogenase subunit G